MGDIVCFVLLTFGKGHMHQENQYCKYFKYQKNHVQENCLQQTLHTAKNGEKILKKNFSFLHNWDFFLKMSMLSLKLANYYNFGEKNRFCLTIFPSAGSLLVI